MRRPAAIGNRAWFAGPTAANGYELWQIDSTAAGTGLAQEFRPGPASGAKGITALLGTDMSAEGDNGNTGYELWKFDIDI